MSSPLVDLNGRVRDRARELRLRRLRIAGVATLVLVVLGLIAWVVTASPLLAVRKVVVVGNQITSTEAIMQAADVPIGQPLARVDVGGISGRVSALPAVGRVEVAVVLPDTISVKVTERAVAFVLATDGGFTWVDPMGQAFNRTSDRPAGVLLAAANPNDQRLLADVATVAGAIPTAMAKNVKVVTAATRDSIVVTLNAGSQIVWGSADSSTLKGQVAAALQSVKATVYDVSDPTHPTTR